MSAGRLTSDCVFVWTQEPWQQQQVEEINQRQGVVAKKTGCKDKETRGDMSQTTVWFQIRGTFRAGRIHVSARGPSELASKARI